LSRKRLVIAIDGPSGAGKSTAGRELAKRLGYTFIDTGAMYRALAVKARRAGVAVDDADALATAAREMDFEFTAGGAGVRLDGEDVTAAIRSREASVDASLVSRHPEVRRQLVERQRELGESGGVVLDGRDIGSAVFPDAELKFFLDADLACRASRRFRELRERASDVKLADIESEIRARDHADSTREDSPLVRAPDAVRIDTTALEPEQIIAKMESEARVRASALESSVR
jgi:cytidylate kinase